MTETTFAQPGGIKTSRKRQEMGSPAVLRHTPRYLNHQHFLTRARFSSSLFPRDELPVRSDLGPLSEEILR